MSSEQRLTTDRQKPTYSIIIPAYNEAMRVSATLERVLAYIAEQGWEAEVIVVNDGSRDNTAEIIRGFAERNPRLQLLENPGNRGKGVYAMACYTHRVILLFSDADLSSPIE